jgi:hypothetical protein
LYAAYEDDKLLAVTVYCKGAEEVTRHMSAMQSKIEKLEGP